MAKVMKAPKPIPATNGETYYIETNLNANNIVGKIKFLLNFCEIDFKNVIIQYGISKSGTTTQDQPKTPIKQSGDDYHQSVFVQWLLDNGLALGTARGYVSSVRSAEVYAKENALEFQTLITDDHELCLNTVAALFQNEAFIELNKAQHNRFRAAITKLLEYYGLKYDFKAARTVFSSTVSIKKPSIDTTPFDKVLAERFARGFRISSPLDMKKFRRYYEEINGEAAELSDSDIEAALISCGIRYDDKIFAPDAMLPVEMRDKLFSFIRTNFDEGKQAVYFEALFQAFSEDFLDYNIYDAQMLKSYIEFYNDGEFHIDAKYISKDMLTQANPQEEIKNYLVAVGVPVESSDICKTLSHISQKKVMQVLGINGEFVNNGKSHYFHVDIVLLSEEEIENIAILIQESINDKQFLSGNELIDMIRARYPFIIENNPHISSIGMRDTIKYYLKERFAFKGNIVSSLDNALSMADVFGSYAKKRPEFTLDELTTLASELNSTIYFDAVYDNSLRVSQDRFVAKDMAQFSVDETDMAIDRFCTDSFIAIEKINGFGSFPDAGFPWNAFLVEQYVYAYSKKYRLYHACFNRDCCVGAIVKNESDIKNFDDLLAMVLGQSNIVLNKERALEFLVEEGYLARKNYSNIEKVLIQANTYRNRKGTK